MVRTRNNNSPDEDATARNDPVAHGEAAAGSGVPTDTPTITDGAASVQGGAAAPTARTEPTLADIAVLLQGLTQEIRHLARVATTPAPSVAPAATPPPREPMVPTLEVPAPPSEPTPPSEHTTDGTAEPLAEGDPQPASRQPSYPPWVSPSPAPMRPPTHSYAAYATVPAHPYAPPPTVPVPAAWEAAPARPEPKVRVAAPSWDGTKEELEEFIDQCELNFEANPAAFQNDARRITFAIGNMSGAPRVRMMNIRQSDDPPSWLKKWSSFCKDLRRVYGDPDPGYTARLKLNNLRQRGPVAQHAAEFMSLAARANATDGRQMLMLFEHSLRPRLRERLMHVPLDDMRNFIQAAILTEKRMQVINEATTPVTAPSGRPRPTAAQPTPRREGKEERPTNRDRPAIPPKDPSRDAAERLRQSRRANGKCYGCGGDHLVRDCPSAAQTQGLRAHALTVDELSGDVLVNPLYNDNDDDGDDDDVGGSPRSAPTDDLAQLRAYAAAFWASRRTDAPRVERDGALLRIHRHPTLPTYECLVTVGNTQGLALLDTGATASFITPEMVTTAVLPTSPLPRPLNAAFLQGRSSSITHFTLADIRIHDHPITSGTRLLITPMSTHDILLGMDWIETARPEPNYTLRTWDLRVPTSLPTPAAAYPTAADLGHLVGERQLISDGEQLLTPPVPDDISPAPRAATAVATGGGPTLPAEYSSYADVFDAQRAEQLPPHRPHDHEIHLEDGKTPPYGPLYSLSHREQEELRTYLQKMESIGFIRPSASRVAAPLLFVPKKDGRLRPCVDYRALNAITVKDRYPIPLISEHLDRLATAQVFTKLDLKGAYNLLRIAPGHEWKTAFRTRYGSYEYLVMPFGLCNAPATFQRLMNHVLSDLLDVSVIVYLDDILVFSDDPTNHPAHVRQVLERLRQHQLYCAPDKCEFHTQSVEFLGYVVSPDGISMDRGKVATVLEWPPPQSVRQIQVFLGFANFYRRFIRHYSRVAAPLTDLLKGGATGKLELPANARDAFNKLKAAFTDAPILRHFSPHLPTVLETDASDAVVAAVLSQWHPCSDDDAAKTATAPNTRTHRLHPIAYWSRKMIPAERNYKIHDKELLAVVDACAHWRHYLHGLAATFIIYTDHQALQYFATKRQLNRRQARWQADMAEYDFEIRYRPGTEAVRPDALSRRHDLFPDGPSRPDPANQAVLLPAHLFANATVIHPALQLPADWLPVLRQTTNLPDGVLFSGTLPRTAGSQIYLPPALRPAALQLVHDHPSAGHPGPKLTAHLASRQFWWPSINQDCEQYARACAACRRAKPPRHKPHGYLVPLHPPDRPWSRISMDHVTDLPPSKADGSTYDAILVVVDRLTKFVVFIPARKTDGAAELAFQLHRYVFAYFGLPDDITSDRGTTFVASLWTELLRILRVRSSFSSAYHPQTNGQTERANQTLEIFLRFYTAYDHSDWASLLPTAQLALNNRPSATTTVAPNAACLSFAPRVHPSLPSTSPAGTAADRLAICQRAIKKANAAVAEAFNRRRSDVSFRRGDLVLLRTKHLRPDRPSRKLSNLLAGPFKVEETVGSRAYRLKLPPSWKVHPVFHVQMLEPYPDGARESSDAPQLRSLEDDYADYKVEAITDSRRRAGRLQYLVKWSGYPASWTQASDVDNAADLVAEFHRRNPSKPRPHRGN